MLFTQKIPIQSFGFFELNKYFFIDLFILFYRYPGTKLIRKNKIQNFF